MWETIKAMPPGVLLFMGYSLLVLSVLGLLMSRVIDEAVQAPISFIGVVWMALLAYLIFTMTLVLQKKQAAYALSLGLTSLLLPLAAIMFFASNICCVSSATVTALQFSLIYGISKTASSLTDTPHCRVPSVARILA